MRYLLLLTTCLASLLISVATFADSKPRAVRATSVLDIVNVSNHPIYLTTQVVIYHGPNGPYEILPQWDGGMLPNGSIHRQKVEATHPDTRVMFQVLKLNGETIRECGAMTDIYPCYLNLHMLSGSFLPPANACLWPIEPAITCEPSVRWEQKCSR